MGNLSNEFAACEEGDKQSPVNIKFSEVEEDQNVPEVQFQYEQATPSVINNGHSIQFNLPAEKKSNFITMDGAKYELNQFHFHTPSEHQLNGENLPMEMHLVHQSANDELAVITLMIEEGTENKELSSIWGELPTETMEKDIKMKESIELMKLIPESSSTFYYSGSLTTPPCSEGVKWIVFENPIEMSKEQIEEFKQIFPNNNRPIQSLNKREVIQNK
ncbi:carbonic anhydrase family protein [Halobacillus shinanisalinarum]|uniref:carbonic anhydrase n=1 Tax=Halobacillus shinanisalinarum TaxID=2932258 RepID=A0ABY4GWJ4_9BACI|nr:carbonic anhydrase family protein [Halobacillus shinanisalinarum]UOQ92371.1 carbonic anhydrase family protein [Halobacillus shinanisalinarum]